MAFETILTTQIEAGDPVTQELFNKVKNSLDDHETRLTDTEAALQLFYPMAFKVQGAASIYVPYTGLIYERVFNNITLTSGRVFVVDAGSSGTTEIDVQLKRGAGAFASVFSTRPSVAYSAGDYALSTNGVLSTTSLLSGDVLRIDIVTAQTGSSEFHVYLTFEAA